MAPDTAPNTAPAGTPDETVEPVLRASGLGVRGRDGWVVRGLDLELGPGTVTALIAPGNAGKSTALLALTGRMAIHEGDVTVGGYAVSTEPRTVRARTSVARIADLVVPEDRHSIAEAVTERCLIDGVRPAVGRREFATVAERIGFTPVNDLALVEDLPPHQQAVLALALAAIRPADVIVLDDTDLRVTAAQERDIYRAAMALAAGGAAVVFTTSRAEGVPDGVVRVQLAAPHPPHPLVAPAANSTTDPTSGSQE